MKINKLATIPCVQIVAFSFSKVFPTSHSWFLEFPVSELSTNLSPHREGIISLSLKMNVAELVLLTKVCFAYSYVSR